MGEEEPPDINHGNWKRAPPEEMEHRVIQKAVRRNLANDRSNNTADETNKNAFGGINQRAFVIPEASYNAFSFLGGSENKEPKDSLTAQNSKVSATLTRDGFGNSPQTHSSLKHSSTLVLEKAFGTKQDENLQKESLPKKQSNEERSLPTPLSSRFKEFRFLITGAYSEEVLPKNGPTAHKRKVSATKTTHSSRGQVPLETDPAVTKSTSATKSDKDSDTSIIAIRNTRSLGESSQQPTKKIPRKTPGKERDFVEPTFEHDLPFIQQPPAATEKTPAGNKSGRSEEFLQNMAEINVSFSSWISKNLAETPTGLLTRCFIDYIRHVQGQFDEEKKRPLDEKQLERLKRQEQVLNELVLVDEEAFVDLAQTTSENPD